MAVLVAGKAMHGVPGPSTDTGPRCVMKLCAECRGNLPFLVVYVLFLAAFVAFLTGVVSKWDPWLTGAMFVVTGALGVAHVFCCSCRLCKAFKHHRQDAAHGART